MRSKVLPVWVPAALIVIILLGAGAAAYSAQAQQSLPYYSNPYSYWPLDGHTVLGAGQFLYDDAVRANDVECTPAAGTCPQEVTGMFGKALQFDGVNDQLSKTRPEGLSWQITDSFSVEAWVKIPADNDCSSVDGDGKKVSNQVFIGRYKDSPTNYTSWWLGCGWEKPGGSSGGDAYAIFHIRDSVTSTGKGLSVFSDVPINDNKWHHIVGVYDGTAKQMRIYVDRKLSGTLSTNFSGNIVTSQRLQFGTYTIADIPGYFYKGILDEVAVYNRALTLTEINAPFPVVQNPGNRVNQVGDTVNLQINVFDPFSDLSFTAANLPPGLTINTSTGVISGTVASGADSGSPYQVTVTVSNADGGSKVVNFTWQIGETQLFLPLVNR